MDERIPNELIDAWAQQQWTLESGIRREIEAMDDDKAEELSKAVESLTTSNCWFAAYDIAPIIKSALSERKRSRAASASVDSRSA